MAKKSVTYESVKCEVSLGVLSGYDNDPEDFDYDQVREYIYQDMEQWYSDHGWAVSFVVMPAHVIYPKVWGGMRGGEPVIHMESIFNPYYDSKLSKTEWKANCVEYLDHLMEVFEQVTMSITFNECQIRYRTDE